MMWLLCGMPSVMTTTTLGTPSRPWRSTRPPATAKAAPVPVVVPLEGTAAKLVSKLCSSAVGACATVALEPKEMRPVRTPLVSPRPLRASSACTKALVLVRPAAPTLPEVSSASTTSRAEAQMGGTSPKAALQVRRLQAAVWRRSLSSGAAQEPSPKAERSTERRRTRCPLRQALLQVDHSVHCERAQSWSQGSALQSSSCIVSPVGRPPCSASRTMVRCLVRVPPPQAREHSDHSCQRPIWPSTGQGFTLQARCVSKLGQSALTLGARMISRVRFCMPPWPQGWEHGSAVQSVTSHAPKKAPVAALPSSWWSFLAPHIVEAASSSCLPHSSTARSASRTTSATSLRRSIREDARLPRSAATRAKDTAASSERRRKPAISRS
mmetsp:Transcript_54309/g.116696  ORF Transcript_54309/g.116696 Transcript_54309/m.116696 type:complete len:382 (-) Transcript_54309:1264-2409(-)